MNIKISVYSLSILLLAALAVSADDAKVSRLGLSPQSGETVLRIDVSGPFQFVHETAEAKDGKPFRLVIDIFPAIHDLSQKDFFDLPKTMISSIRTSQYSVKPEKVVRIVCDLDQTAMYRVEKKGSSVYLYLPDKKSGSFTSWSSPLKITRPAKAPVTVADVSTQKKDKPVKKVVKKKVVKKVKTATSPSAGTPEKAKVTLAKHYQAKSSDFIVKKSGQPKPLVKSKSTVTTVAAPPKEKVAKKAIVKVDLPKPEPKSDQPVQEYTMLKKTAPASKKKKRSKQPKHLRLSRSLRQNQTRLPRPK